MGAAFRAFCLMDFFWTTSSSSDSSSLEEELIVSSSSSSSIVSSISKIFLYSRYSLQEFVRTVNYSHLPSSSTILTLFLLAPEDFVAEDDLLDEALTGAAFFLLSF